MNTKVNTKVEYMERSNHGARLKMSEDATLALHGLLSSHRARAAVLTNKRGHQQVHADANGYMGKVGGVSA